MDNERDTHFQGFAKLVAQDIGNDMGIIFDTGWLPEEEYLKAISKIIARRAYDLANHIVSEVTGMSLDLFIPYEQIIDAIPDLTKWPNEQ